MSAGATPPPTLRDRLACSVAASRGNWKVARGTYTTWRLHGEYAEATSEPVAWPHRFTAWSTPFCIRLQAIPDSAPADVLDYPEVVLGRPSCWWTRGSDGRLDSGGWTVIRVIDFDGLETVLRTHEWFWSAFKVSRVQYTHRDGRPTWLVRARATGRLASDAPTFYASGADRDEFEIDAKTGIVVGWRAYAEGRWLARCQIDALEVDPPGYRLLRRRI